MSVAERYVELCLRLVRHDEELLDYYYGPAELAARVEREALPEPAQLAEDARTLAAETDSAYLSAQLRGLEIVARRLGGEEIAYEEEVEGCYGIRAERVPEERFEAAHRALDELLPGEGPLAERYRRWEDGDPIPRDRIETVLRTVGERLRAWTRERLGLPEGEAYDLELVDGKHWYAFNDYRGGLRSRVQVNTDLPINAPSVVALIAHELYPGHHSERAWKEQLLYRRGRLEESVLVYGTPQSVVTEGIAVLAVDTVVAEAAELLAAAFEECGVRYDPELAARIRPHATVLEDAVSNAAILLHVEGAPAEDAAEYVRRWQLVSEKRARQHIAFVLDRWGRTYIRTYSDGHALCRDWVAGDPGRMRRLLSEQLTPGDLVPAAA